MKQRLNDHFIIYYQNPYPLKSFKTKSRCLNIKLTQFKHSLPGRGVFVEFKQGTKSIMTSSMEISPWLPPVAVPSIIILKSVLLTMVRVTDVHALS